MDMERAMAAALEGQFWGWDRDDRFCNLAAVYLPKIEGETRVQRERRRNQANRAALAKPKEKVSFENDFHLTCRVILKAVAYVSDVSLASLKGPTRAVGVVHARQAAMWLCRELIGASGPQIGRTFNRDHSTVFHGCKSVDRDPLRFQRIISGVKAMISVGENGGVVINLPDTNRAEGVLEAPATALTAPTFCGGQHG